MPNDSGTSLNFFQWPNLIATTSKPFVYVLFSLHCWQGKQLFLFQLFLIIGKRFSECSRPEDWRRKERWLFVCKPGKLGRGLIQAPGWGLLLDRPTFRHHRRYQVGKMFDSCTRRQTKRNRQTKKEVLWVENAGSELRREQQRLRTYKWAHHLMPHLAPFILSDVCPWKQTVKGTENCRGSKQHACSRRREHKPSEVAQPRSPGKVCSCRCDTATLWTAADTSWCEDHTHGANISTLQVPHGSSGQLWIYPWRSWSAEPGRPTLGREAPRSSSVKEVTFP